VQPRWAFSCSICALGVALKQGASSGRALIPKRSFFAPLQRCTKCSNTEVLQLARARSLHGSAALHTHVHLSSWRFRSISRYGHRSWRADSSNGLCSGNAEPSRCSGKAQARLQPQPNSLPELPEPGGPAHGYTQQRGARAGPSSFKRASRNKAAKAVYYGQQRQHSVCWRGWRAAAAASSKSCAAVL
jgi:hypothetical protein